MAKTIRTPSPVSEATQRSSGPTPAAAQGGCTTGGPPRLPPPYGDEPPDYERYSYGYPPFSGRMFGSGN